MGACCGWWDGSGIVPDDDDGPVVVVAIVVAIVPVVAARVLGVWIGLDRNRFWRGDAGPPDLVGEVTITAAFSLTDKDGLRFFGGAICELTTLAKSDKGWSPFFLPLSVDSSCDFIVPAVLCCCVVTIVDSSSSSSSSSLETAGVAGISSEALVSGLVNVAVVVLVVVVVVFPVVVVFFGDPKSVVTVVADGLDVVFPSSFMAVSSLLVLLAISSSSSSCSASSISSSSSLSLPWSTSSCSSPRLVGVPVVVVVVVGPTATTLA
jgi:hypothetical protein